MEITINSSLAETLNAFIADEHIASVQYKMARVVARGSALHFADKIFDENGEEEEEHFDELVTYAQSLNIPVQVNPSQMEINCTTPFVDMNDGDSTMQIVAILISAEKKAIEGYETALRNTTIINGHPELTQFFGELLNDERGHLKELEDVKSNIEGGGTAVTQMEQPETVDVTPPEGQLDAYGYEINTDVNMGESSNRNITAKMLADVMDESVDAKNLSKNLISYMGEDDIEKFAEKYNYFDTSIAKTTSIHENRQCANVFLEFMDDDMVSTKLLAARLLDSMDESEVEEFAKTFGYINEDAAEERVENVRINESALSFSNMFSEVMSK